MFVFKSQDVAERDRIEAWSDFFRVHLVPTRVEPAGQETFQVEADFRSLGALPALRVQGQGYMTFRKSYEINTTAEHGYGICLVLDDNSFLDDYRTERRLRMGDLCLLDSTNGFLTRYAGPHRHIAVRLPKGWIEARIRHPHLLGGSVLSSGHPMSFLLADYLASYYRQAGQLSEPESLMISGHMLDLLSAALTGQPVNGSDSAAVRAALFDQACRLIAQRAFDCRLRPQTIAHQMHISVRTLQRSFADRNETVMQRVTRERIAKATELLESQRSTITEIAFAVGFADVTTFDRAFRTLKGTTPSAWRRNAARPNYCRDELSERRTG